MEGSTPNTPQDAGKPRLLAGKYTTQEALERGYTEQRNETQRIIAERKALEDQNRMLQATLASMQSAGDEGVDENDDLSPRQRQALQSLIVDTVTQVLNPLMTSAEAVATFGSRQGEITEFLRSNPDIQTTFQSMVGGSPTGAARFVELEYEKRLGEVANAEADKANTESRTTREAARAHATIPTGRADSRAPATAESEHEAQAERLNKLAEYGRQSGDYAPLARERLLTGPGAIEIWGPGEPPPPSMMGKKQE